MISLLITPTTICPWASLQPLGVRGPHGTGSPMNRARILCEAAVKLVAGSARLAQSPQERPGGTSVWEDRDYGSVGDPYRAVLTNHPGLLSQ